MQYNKTKFINGVQKQRFLQIPLRTTTTNCMTIFLRQTLNFMTAFFVVTTVTTVLFNHNYHYCHYCHDCHYCHNHHHCHYCRIGRQVGRFKLPFYTLKVTFSQRSRTDQRIDGPTDGPTTTLLELLRAAKNNHFNPFYIFLCVHIFHILREICFIL